MHRPSLDGRCHGGHTRLPVSLNGVRRSNWIGSVLLLHEAKGNSDRPSACPHGRPSRSNSLTAASRQPFLHSSISVNGYVPLPLPDALDLPNHTDLARISLLRLITTDQLFEIRQKRGHPKAAEDKDALIFTYRSTDPLRFTEMRTLRVHSPTPLAGRGVVKQFPP